MIDVVGAEARLLDLIRSQVFCKLTDDSGHNLHMGQLLRANVSQKSLSLCVGHGVTLGKIAHGSADFSVRPAILTHNKLCNLWVWLSDFYRVLKPFFISPHKLHLPFPWPLFCHPGPAVYIFDRVSQKRTILCLPGLHRFPAKSGSMMIVI